jgi:hypothetical protein
MNAQPSAPSQRIYRWFGHPIVGIIGWLATLVAIPLAIYLYIAGDHQPNLTYVIHPAKAAVVRAAQSSALSVTFGGKILAGDITAAQLAFWNAGSRAIHRNEILKPLRIFTRPTTAILEVRIRRTSRSVINIELDQSRLAQGELVVWWNILEPNDGAIIQLIYAGGENIDVEADGTMEGQSRITHPTDQPELTASDYAQYEKDRTVKVILNITIVVLVVFVLLILGVTLLAITQRDPKQRFVGIVLVILGLLVMLAGIHDLSNLPPVPPFGF